MGRRKIKPLRARSSKNLVALLAFLYAPERFARASRFRWSASLERRRRGLLVSWIYRLARTPIETPDGSRRIAPLKPVYVWSSPSVREALDNRGMEYATDILPSVIAGRSPDVIEGGSFLVSANPWGFALVREEDAPRIRTAMERVYLEAVLADRRRWRVCPRCGRAFPASRKARACAPCRRRWTRRQIQRLLASAPADPVVLRMLPRGAFSEIHTVFLRSGPASVEENLGFRHIPIFAEGLRLPPSLRRLAPRAALRTPTMSL